MATNSWLINQTVYVLKKHLSEILKDRFYLHEEIIERIGVALQTNKDLDDFGKLVADIYECGYFKSFGDYEKQLRDLGYNVKVTTPETVPDTKKIFNTNEENKIFR